MSKHKALAVPVRATYSCAKCPGYCCSYAEIEITERDIARLARHFDIGYARVRFASLLRAPERDELRGRRFARALLDRARRERPAALPLVLAHLAAKWLGYRAGLAGPALPVTLARRLSGQDYYWDGAAATAAADAGPATSAPTTALGRAG